MNSAPFDIAVSNSTDWLINGEEADAEMRRHLNEDVACGADNWDQGNCPHCNRELAVKVFNDVATDNIHWHNDRWFVSRRCANCAFWDFNGMHGGNKCMDPQQLLLLTAVTARYSKTFPDGCTQELAQHLKRHPKYWHEIPPKRLEKLVADIFKANHHGAETFHVGKPHDGGVDVVFVESQGTRWLIQVKRREQPMPSEGFSTLQSILGTLALEGTRHGIVVSTADAFSYYARQARARAEQKGFVVEFVDKGKLARMISPLLPHIPWSEIFSHPELSEVDPDVVRHFWPGYGGQLLLGLDNAATMSPHS